jgi:hypothetical protein
MINNKFFYKTKNLLSFGENELFDVLSNERAIARLISLIGDTSFEIFIGSKQAFSIVVSPPRQLFGSFREFGEPAVATFSVTAGNKFRTTLRKISCIGYLSVESASNVLIKIGLEVNGVVEQTFDFRTGPDQSSAASFFFNKSDCVPTDEIDFVVFASPDEFAVFPPEDFDFFILPSRVKIQPF